MKDYCLGMGKEIHFGTCSWKYDSWRGLIYPEKGQINYLREYSYYYDCVEVDQWFWSLFKENRVVLPKADVVCDYAASVPEDFLFAIKVPNSITLTHHYQKDKKQPLKPNPHFLSSDLFNRFLETLEPLHNRIGPLLFQFEYLNKNKMASREEFIDRMGSFIQELPPEYTYCIETRNPNYLSQHYFEFLSSADLHHVFLQGYYMPSIFKIYKQFKGYFKKMVIVRLHGPERKKIEQQTGKKWNRILTPREDDLMSLTSMLHELGEQGVETFVFVNNHFEGSAPRTISRIKKLLD